MKSFKDDAECDSTASYCIMQVYVWQQDSRLDIIVAGERIRDTLKVQ